MAVDEVIVNFKRESHLLTIHISTLIKKNFDIEIYTLYNKSGYTYIMSVYFVNQRNLASTEATFTNGTVL